MKFGTDMYKDILNFFFDRGKLETHLVADVSAFFAKIKNAQKYHVLYIVRKIISF